MISKPPMGVVHWKINGVEGHGMPVVMWLANAWVKGQNNRYGPGSHWVVPCKPDLRVVE